MKGFKTNTFGRAPLRHVPLGVRLWISAYGRALFKRATLACALRIWHTCSSALAALPRKAAAPPRYALSRFRVRHTGP